MLNTMILKIEGCRRRNYKLEVLTWCQVLSSVFLRRQQNSKEPQKVATEPRWEETHSQYGLPYFLKAFKAQNVHSQQPVRQCVCVCVCVRVCEWGCGDHKEHKNRRSQLSPHLAKFASRLITAKKRQQLCSSFLLSAPLLLILLSCHCRCPCRVVVIAKHVAGGAAFP